MHRGAKDFSLPKSLAEKTENKVSILFPGQISLGDEQAGFSTEITRWRKVIGDSGVRLETYTGWRRIRKTQNKTISYMVPNPISYFQALRRIKPNVIIDFTYTTLTPRSMLNSIYARYFGSKIILMDAGDDAKNKFVFPFERGVYLSSDAVFTYNQASVDRIRTKYQLPNKEKFVIYTKFLNNDDFPFLPEEVQNPPTIGYVGRFLKSKGFDKFIEYANNNTETHSFIVAGINEDKFAIPSHIHVYENIPNDKLQKIYSKIDILVIPDLSQFKSYATVVQEALLCGCSVWVGGIAKEYFPKPELVNLFSNLDSNPGFLEEFSDSSREDKIRFRSEKAKLAHSTFNSSFAFEALNSIILNVK